MKVRQITLDNFTSHDRTDVYVPERGLVLVTGANGSGKSSLLEGVAWAGWGEMLRGSNPWREDAPCGASIETDSLSIERTRKGAKGRTSLTWNEDGQAPKKYESPTHAQEQLEHVIGNFDLWRRTHVFSSADAAHFSSATDATRKRLIESFLGLDRFDHALAACRADLSRAALAAERTRNELARAQAEHDAHTRRAEEAQRTLASMREAAPPAVHPPKGRTVAELDTMLATAGEELRAVEDALSVLARADGERATEARHLRAQLDRLRASVCPACTQAIHEETREKLRAEVARAETELRVAQEAQRTRGAALDLQREELREEVQALRAAQRKRLAEETAYAAARETAERSKRMVQQAERAFGEALACALEAAACIGELEAKAGDATALELELAAVERALGLKGIRAHVLTRALSGIEAVANSWLAQIHPAVRVSVRGYSDKKGGGTTDAIAIEVHGAGGGQGYKASSGGERRRIDIAMLLALAEVAAAAHGSTGGTLWLDEVFDALDEDGLDAVVAVLRQLSEERAVVVFTHAPLLVAKMKTGATRWHVAGGTVQVGGSDVGEAR